MRTSSASNETGPNKTAFSFSSITLYLLCLVFAITDSSARWTNSGAKRGTSFFIRIHKVVVIVDHQGSIARCRVFAHAHGERGEHDGEYGALPWPAPRRLVTVEDTHFFLREGLILPRGSVTHIFFCVLSVWCFVLLTDAVVVFFVFFYF